MELNDAATDFHERRNERGLRKYTPPDSPGTVNEHALNVSLVNIVNTVYDLHEDKR